MQPRKKIPQQSIIGQRGVNLIEQIVLKMGYIWRPTLVFDVGIDGEIEIRDPETGEATNTIIKVQAKATTQRFQSETANSFQYHCNQRDLDYWLRGNVPVILVVCRPDSDEAYWVSIREYFNNPTAKETRRIRFDKQENRFDALCAPKLKQLALSKDSGIYFAPLQKTETLYSNLLKVTSFAPTIYVADTSYRNPEAIWEKFRSMDIKVGGEWILIQKQIVSFRNLREPPFDKICDLGTCEYFVTREWADSDDEDMRRLFVRLLNRCLREKTWHLGLRFNPDREYYYFSATRDLRPRKVSYQSHQKRVVRDVFKRYPKKSDPSQTGYYRHAAFIGHFQRLGDKWYLEISPTYHFTSNGHKEDLFRTDRLQGIKRLDRNPAVLGQLLMWADYLGRSTGDLYSSEYAFLSFGELETVDTNTSLPDDIWYNAEEQTEVKNLGNTENQLELNLSN